MFKETLLISPKLNNSDLNAMERNLSTRFGKVAKKFGKGLASAVKGGAVAGAALALIDKILNPLKETQDAIDRTLNAADSLSTMAEQFNTQSGTLFRVQQIAKSTGVDESTLDMLMTKFQVAIAEAEEDPNKDSVVRPWARVKNAKGNLGPEQDIAEAFLNFIQSMRGLETGKRLLIEEQVFGEKKIPKLADFIQSDLTEQNRLIGGKTPKELTGDINRLSALENMQKVLAARSAINDMGIKGSVINASMIQAQAKAREIDLANENKRIKSYNDLALISEASTRTVNLLGDLLLNATSWVVKATELSKSLKSISESPVLKGLRKLGGD